ncbi:hypothetical protein [Actinoplanes solisilvae]|uniref:hypothetical protein n=1 Tax=Actinoplanes solisilvae TaxID=2486853 RepID=UPI000FDAF20B|nr:hypothetical protein [Actinoplanes solisilvae]
MVNELAEKIADALNEALDQRVATDHHLRHVERGLAAGGPEEPIIAMTIDEVARIAARAARDASADTAREAPSGGASGASA